MPSDRSPLWVCCLLTVLLAGCAGGPAGDATPAATATESPTPTDGATDRPGVIPANETVVAYANLSATQKQAFDRELAGEEVVLLDGEAWGTPETYTAAEAVYGAWPVALSGGDQTTYVRRDGTYYRVGFDFECCVGPVTELGLSELNGSADGAVDAANRSGRGWEFVRHAIEQEGLVRGWRVDLPVGTDDVVEFQGRYYRVERVSVADFGRGSMSVTELDEG